MFDTGSVINAFASLLSGYSIVLRFLQKDSGSQVMLGPSEKTLCIFNFSHFILPMVNLHMACAKCFSIKNFICLDLYSSCHL